jgi:hypothetical protein
MVGADPGVDDVAGIHRVDGPGGPAVVADLWDLLPDQLEDPKVLAASLRATQGPSGSG